jgi:hypothetical protein
MELKKSSAQFAVEVSEAEKTRATHLREKLDDLAKYIIEFQEFFEAFFKSLDAITDSKQLASIGSLVVRYKFKLREKFNNCVKALSLVVVANRELFKESKTDSIRDVIIAHFSESRLDFIELMGLLSDYTADDFIENGKEMYDQINKTMEKVLSAVQEEWIAHIDKNILGKIKLSSKTLPLVRIGEL